MGGFGGHRNQQDLRSGSTEGFRLSRLCPRITPERWITVNASAVRVENCAQFGGPWLALELIKKIGLDDFLRHFPANQTDVRWPSIALILVVCRLCRPSSELHIAEHFYRDTALEQLLGVPATKVYHTRLYRALDHLLPHKDKLELFLKHRLGELLELKYDLLLYDVTSTYFEGQVKANPKAKYGYSREKRSDCKQVCIALVVSRCGMPIGYEVFDGNRRDSTTVEEVVRTMKSRYGTSNRVWVMDRGMLSETNIKFLKNSDRRYIIGTLKSMLKQFERELLEESWDHVLEGVKVKLFPSPDGGEETFILCQRLDSRRTLTGIHAIDPSRISVSHSEKRLANSSHLASKGRPRIGPYSGLLSGVRLVEDARPAVPRRGSGRRTATRV